MVEEEELPLKPRQLPGAEVREVVALEVAANRFCAEAICADRAVPTADNSAMDGYAVASQDVPGTLVISQRVPAGQGRPASLPVGQKWPGGQTPVQVEVVSLGVSP